MGSACKLRLRETLQVFGKFQHILSSDSHRRQGNARLFQIDQLSGPLEPQSGFQGQSQHEPLGECQLHYKRIYTQRPEFILFQRLHPEHKEQHCQHDLPFPQLEMVTVDHRQCLAALTRLHSCGLVPELHTYNVAGLSFQTQTRGRRRKMV